MGVFDWTGDGFDDWTGGGSDWWDFGGDGLGGSLGDGGSDWADWGDGLDLEGNFDGGGSGGGSSGFNWSSLFGSGSGGASGSSSGIWGALLSGLSGAAKGYMSGKDLKEGYEAQGKEQRKTSAFEADLLDYYKQKDKVRKRTALDTYGQFSHLSTYAPDYAAAPPIDMPTKPVAG